MPTISAFALRLFGLPQSADRLLGECLGRFDDQGKGNAVTTLADQGGKFGRSHAHDDRHVHLPGVQGDLQVHGIDLGDRDDQRSAFDEALIATSDFYPVKRFLLNLKRAASWTQTVETWKILLGINEQQCLPILASRLRIDPAIVSGPFMSTLVDATGLLIYLQVAKMMLGI